MVVKEIHDGYFIFQSYAAITPERFWTAALQHAAPITTAKGLQLGEWLKKPGSPRLGKAKDPCFYIPSLKAISCTRWE